MKRLEVTSRHTALVALTLAAVVVACVKLGYSNRVLWRVTSPDSELVAVCQEIPVFDGPSYDLRLERPDGTLVRRLYKVGDGDPCTEIKWSPDGRALVVLSGHVARMVFVDVAWALANPNVETAHWSWRQVSFSSDRQHLEGSHVQFVSATTVELRLCPPRSTAQPERCPEGSPLKRFEIPLPIVTGHRVGQG